MTDYKQALVDLLAEVPMPSITRHWADEYLDHLSISRERAQELLEKIEDLEIEVAGLEQETYSLEGQIEDLQIELDNLRSDEGDDE